MKSGFVPALGTPLDKDGNLVADSFVKHINDQIDAGAAGLLVMGSMGIEACIRHDVYPEVARVAVEAAAGRVPVFLGAMDVSVARVKDRIAATEHLDIDGYVFLTPFYSAVTPTQAMNFFRGVAALTKHNILIYDLPSVTQRKITYEMVLELIATVPNFVGIKSADTVMFRKLNRNPMVPKDFIMVYSGLDMFDIAYKGGITKCLDGMLSCTPVNTGKMFKAMEDGDYETAALCLDNIVNLRDCFAMDGEIMPAFTAAMNLLGYEGSFAQDYASEVTEKTIESVRAEMIRIGELPA